MAVEATAQQKLPRTVARLEHDTRNKLKALQVKWRRPNVSDAISHMIDELYKVEFPDA